MWHSWKELKFAWDSKDHLKSKLLESNKVKSELEDKSINLTYTTKDKFMLEREMDEKHKQQSVLELYLKHLYLKN